MKVIRQIKSVAVCKDIDDENNNELSLDDFDKEPGFYQSVIRPMLAPGHEGELISWLKSIGLLVQSLKCKNADINESCSAPMIWSPARIVDNFQWKCLSCLQKRTIRDESIFNDVKCNLKNVIRVLLGWCKGNDEQLMANILGIRKQVVKDIYKIAARTSDKYIQSHLNEFKLGGPGVVVVIDVYPDGFTLKNSLNVRTQNIRPILCLAEIKHIPTKFWLEALDHHNRSSEQINLVNQSALKIVQQIVLPGSILVTNLTSKICSYYTLQTLNHLYPVIVSTEGLLRHNNQFQSLVNNLETVWKPALHVCEEAQYYPQSDVNYYLLYFLWRQRFGNESLEMLLNQMSYI